MKIQIVFVDLGIIYFMPEENKTTSETNKNNKQISKMPAGPNVVNPEITQSNQKQNPIQKIPIGAKTAELSMIHHRLINKSKK